MKIQFHVATRKYGKSKFINIGILFNEIDNDDCQKHIN
jgi:hypothetical protein